MATGAIHLAIAAVWQIFGASKPPRNLSSTAEPSNAPSRPVQTDPKAAAAAVERAHTMLVANEYVKTIAAAAEAILLHPKNPEAFDRIRAFPVNLNEHTRRNFQRRCRIAEPSF
jgi:hypothetical protein